MLAHTALLEISNLGSYVFVIIIPRIDIKRLQQNQRQFSCHQTWFKVTPPLSLSHTALGLARGSNTVYSVIHGLTGTSNELQPCVGMSWYDLDSNVARVCTNKARIHSIKQGSSRFAKRFSYDCRTVPRTV